MKKNKNQAAEKPPFYYKKIMPQHEPQEIYDFNGAEVTIKTAAQGTLEIEANTKRCTEEQRLSTASQIFTLLNRALEVAGYTSSEKSIFFGTKQNDPDELVYKNITCKKDKKSVPTDDLQHIAHAVLNGLEAHNGYPFNEATTMVLSMIQNGQCMPESRKSSLPSQPKGRSQSFEDIGGVKIAISMPSAQDFVLVSLKGDETKQAIIKNYLQLATQDLDRTVQILPTGDELCFKAINNPQRGNGKIRNKQILYDDVLGVLCDLERTTKADKISLETFYLEQQDMFGTGELPDIPGVSKPLALSKANQPIFRAAVANTLYTMKVHAPKMPEAINTIMGMVFSKPEMQATHATLLQREGQDTVVSAGKVKEWLMEGIREAYPGKEDDWVEVVAKQSISNFRANLASRSGGRGNA